MSPQTKALPTARCRRPLGVMLISIYSATVGVISLLAGAMASLVSGGADVSIVFSLLGFLITLMGVALIAAGYGLWTLQHWGRHFSVLVYWASIALAVLFLLPIIPGQQVSLEGTLFQLFGIVINGAILWYLRKPSITGIFDLRGAVLIAQ